jgi:hypothetical protein
MRRSRLLYAFSRDQRMACVRLIGLPQDCVHLRDSSGGSVAKFCPRQSYREFRPFSGGDVEQGIDEGGLGDDVVPTNPFTCPFLIIARVS